MGKKTLPIVVLVAAVAGLVGSGAWAVNRESHNPSWMHSSSAAWMMSYRSGDAAPVSSIADARARAQTFANRLNLKVAEVIQFTNNFYVRLDDKSGRPATEVLVDPATGNTSLEYGPAMMWNTRYGMMTGRARSGMMGGGSGMMGGSSGMMGGSTTGAMGSSGMMGGSSGMMGGSSGMMGGAGGPTWTPSAGTVSGPISADQALTIARGWLSTRDPSLTIRDADSFPGYFTMETLRDGKVHGMLSVNASTGALWDHWWHGTYVAIAE